MAEKGLLQKRLITPLWTDKDSVVISASLQAGIINNYNKVISSTDQLILTPTANLAAGTRVKSLNDVNANEQLATNKSLIFPVKPDTKPSKNSLTTSPVVNKAAANSSTPTQN